MDESSQRKVRRRITVIGSDLYGLPMASDDDVVIGLMQLSRRDGFSDRKLTFSRYELRELLGWSDNGHRYNRLEESLKRWASVTFNFEGWWEKGNKKWVDVTFHLIDVLDLNPKGGLRGSSSIQWNDVIFRSFRDGNLKPLDLDVYFSLKYPISRRLYRWLDKHFHYRDEVVHNLHHLAFDHIGMSRKYDTGKLKSKLQPALAELEGVGFIAVMPESQRYQKHGRGIWNVVLSRPSRKPPAAIPPEERPPAIEVPAIIALLVERNVALDTAVELSTTHPAEEIELALEHLDFLKKRQRIASDPAWIVSCLRRGWKPPDTFHAEKKQRELAANHRGASPAPKDRERGEEEKAAGRVDAIWQGMDEAERERVADLGLAEASDDIRKNAALPPSHPLRRLAVVMAARLYIEHHMLDDRGGQ